MAYRAFLSIRIVEEQRAPVPGSGEASSVFGLGFDPRPDEEVSALFTSEGGSMGAALQAALVKADRFNAAIGFTSATETKAS